MNFCSDQICGMNFRSDQIGMNFQNEKNEKMKKFIFVFVFFRFFHFCSFRKSGPNESSFRKSGPKKSSFFFIPQRFGIFGQTSSLSVFILKICFTIMSNMNLLSFNFDSCAQSHPHNLRAFEVKKCFQIFCTGEHKLQPTAKKAEMKMNSK